MSKTKNMYADAKTWNPFKGCAFACTYCTPSFQRQSKRQKHICHDCYTYTPHCHADRLDKIPSAPIIFVCGNADISFCPPDFTRRIIERIVKHNARAPHKTYYLQSKRPAYFEQFLADLPANVILLTTLETNRDAGYDKVSKAPPPTVRYEQFKALDYARKVVTIEPVLDFDLETFAGWICSIQPETVWLGFNSRPKSVKLTEPAEEKVQELANRLLDAGIEVRGKTLRGVKLPVGSPCPTSQVPDGPRFSRLAEQNAGMAMPGDGVKLGIRLGRPIAIDDGAGSAIREGGRTVGSGVDTKVLE